MDMLLANAMAGHWGILSAALMVVRRVETMAAAMAARRVATREV